MKLHEIISANDMAIQDMQHTILIEKILPYTKSLNTYYKNQFSSEPVLLVASVSNAAQYGAIVPADEFCECCELYLTAAGIEDAEEREHATEEISFNSKALSDFS